MTGEQLLDLGQLLTASYKTAQRERQVVLGRATRSARAESYRPVAPVLGNFVRGACATWGIGACFQSFSPSLAACPNIIRRAPCRRVGIEDQRTVYPRRLFAPPLPKTGVRL